MNLYWSTLLSAGSQVMFTSRTQTLHTHVYIPVPLHVSIFDQLAGGTARSVRKLAHRTDWLWIVVRFPVEAQNYFLRRSVETVSGSHIASNTIGNEGCYPRSKAAETWGWIITSIPAHCFTACTRNTPRNPLPAGLYSTVITVTDDTVKFIP